MLCCCAAEAPAAGLPVGRGGWAEVAPSANRGTEGLSQGMATVLLESTLPRQPGRAACPCCPAGRCEVSGASEPAWRPTSSITRRTAVQGRYAGSSRAAASTHSSVPSESRLRCTAPAAGLLGMRGQSSCCVRGSPSSAATVLRASTSTAATAAAPRGAPSGGASTPVGHLLPPCPSGMNVISVLCSGTGPGRGAASDPLLRRPPPPPLPLTACAVATEPLPALLLRRSERPPAELPCEPEAFQLLNEGRVDSPAASGWMSGSEGWGPGSGAGASACGTAADACSAAVMPPLPDGCKVWAATLAAGVPLAAIDSWAAARLRPGERGCGTAGTPAERPAAAGTFVHGFGAATSGTGGMAAVAGRLLGLLERSDSPTPRTKSTAMSCGKWR